MSYSDPPITSRKPLALPVNHSCFLRGIVLEVPEAQGDSCIMDMDMSCSYFQNKPTDSPTLEELRPLMLCESLRKVWSALVISRIQQALYQHKALDPAQHGYLFGKSTRTASMIHINGIEDAEELERELLRSSYDLKKALKLPVNHSCSSMTTSWSSRKTGTFLHHGNGDGLFLLPINQLTHLLWKNCDPPCYVKRFGRF